jgi:hypothetical protein
MAPANSSVQRDQDRKAAILVMERGSLWPGRTLDWAGHVSVVLQPASGNAGSTLLRVRRALGAQALRLRSLECIAVAFADDAAARGRNELVAGLGSLLVEIGCRRLVLAAYHIERMELAELMQLVEAPARTGNGEVSIEVCFQRVPGLRCGPARGRHCG